MSDIKPISDKGQKAISETIEKYMPEKDKSLASTELISYFIESLGEEADGNEFVSHLVQNTDKSFNSDQLKLLAGKYGVEEYRDAYEASVKEATQTKANGSPAENKKTFKEQVLGSDPQMEVIFDNLKEQFKKENRSKYKGVSDQEFDKIAEKIILNSMNEAKKLQQNNENKNRDKSNQINQPQDPQGFGGGGGIPQSGAALMELAKTAFKIAGQAAAVTLGATAGVIDGVYKKTTEMLAGPVGNDNDIDTLDTEPESKKMKVSYQDEILNKSRDKLTSSLAELDSDLEKYKASKKSGKWEKWGKGLTPEKGEKYALNKIEKKLTEIGDIKNVIRADSKREDVSNDARMKAIDSLDKAADTMKNVDDSLDNSNSELAIKEKAKAIAKSIARLISSIKNLFTRSKDNESGTSNTNENKNNLSFDM